MKKLLIAALAFSAASPALAEHFYESIIGEYENHAGFDNRGQCESTIKHERNERRQHYDTTPFSATDPEYNHVIKERVWCEVGDDGNWYLVGN